MTVRFQGDGSGIEELSWGQLSLLEAMDRQATWMPIGWTEQLRAGTTVDELADDLRFCMSRYQTMRTRLRFDSDGPRQIVSQEGEIPLEVIDAGDEDPATVAERVEKRYRETGYDFVSQWPVRTAVIRHRGILTHRVLIMCHLVTDAAGALVMLADLAGRDPITGDAASPPPEMQPLAQVRWQRSPAGQRVSEAAIQYMDNLARTIPPRRFGNSADPRQPRYWDVGLRSLALPLAIRAITDRTGAGSAMVLLASFMVAQARVTGHNPAATHVLVDNRFRPRLANVVCPLGQGALLAVDVSDITFDEALVRTRGRAIVAYKHAYYDPYRKTFIRWAPRPEGMEMRIGRERGEEIDIGSFINDLRPRAFRGASPAAPAPRREQLQEALPLTTFTCRKQQDQPTEKLFINIDNVVDPAGIETVIDIGAQADTHHISPADLEALLRETENVAVEAAFDGAPPTLV